jgi:hypothetical protein
VGFFGSNPTYTLTGLDAAIGFGSCKEQSEKNAGSLFICRRHFKAKYEAEHTWLRVFLAR